MPIPSLPDEILETIFYNFLDKHRHRILHDRARGFRPSTYSEDEEEVEETSDEKDGPVGAFLGRFDFASRQLLRTFLEAPQLGHYVRSLYLYLAHLNGVEEGVKLLEAVVAPSVGLQQLEIAQEPWSFQDGLRFDARLVDLAPPLTKLDIPGARWSKGRLVRLLRAFPELRHLHLNDAYGAFEESDVHGETAREEGSEPTFHLSTLDWLGFEGVGKDVFGAVAFSSASALHTLRIPLRLDKIDLSSFAALTKLHIDIMSSSSDDLDVDSARAVVGTVSSCQALSVLLFVEWQQYDDCISSEIWEAQHLFHSLPSSLTSLSMENVNISHAYILTLLRDASLLRSLTTMTCRSLPDPLRMASSPAAVARQAEVERVCAERGIELNGRKASTRLVC